MANVADAFYQIADRAVVELHRRGELLHLTAQNLIEFRNVATRPAAANGLGLALATADAKATAFEASFRLLPETPDIYPAWKNVVTAASVIGKRVHDARLVAVCHVQRVSHLLTFNTAHFLALAKVSPGIVIIDPVAV